MLLTLPLREVVAATPRARIARIDLVGQAFRYKAGQAVRVGTPGMDARRSYSIAASPEDAAGDGWLELLVGVEADGTAGPHLALEPGRDVDVEGPFGTFTFPDRPAEPNFLFVAGGTGIAPLRAMLRHAIQSIPGRHIGVIYSARTPEEFAYQDELRALAASGAIGLRQTVTREPESVWIGARGRIDKSMLSAFVRSPETLCFVCGPFAMVDEIPKLLQEIGIAKGRIKIEEG